MTKCKACNKEHPGYGWRSDKQTRLDLECNIAWKLMDWCPMIHMSHSTMCRDKKHLRQAKEIVKGILRNVKVCE